MTISCPHCGGAVHEIDLEFNAETGVVRCGNRTVKIHPRGIDILECLIDAYPRAISHDLVCRTLGNTRNSVVEDPVTPGIIQSHIAVLRKLFAKSNFPLSIVTVNDGDRRGYMLAPQRAQLVVTDAA